MTAEEERQREQPRDERADRRDERKRAEREHIKKHGSRLAEIYRNAILKRAKKGKA